ncbi:MAG: hypothetical protein KKC19_01985 [Nanoarchaeota archaeon]|nr:hypothetical protein [Nanoarchaeota archaeon]
MEKGGLIFTFLLVLMFGVVSAQYSSGYGYGGFYLDDYVNGNFISYSILFVIFFWILQVILSRVPMFRGADGSKKQATIGALLFSTGITYWLYRSNWNFDNLIYRFGFSDGLTSVLLVLILLVVMFLVIKKIGFYGLFLLSGAALIVISFTDLVYDKISVLIIGIVLFVIGLWLWRRRENKPKEESFSSTQNINVNVGGSDNFQEDKRRKEEVLRRAENIANLRIRKDEEENQRKWQKAEARKQIEIDESKAYKEDSKRMRREETERLLREKKEKENRDWQRRYEEQQKKNQEIEKFRMRKEQEMQMRYEEKKRKKTEKEMMKAEEEARKEEARKIDDFRSNERKKLRNMYKRLNSELIKQEQFAIKGVDGAEDKVKKLKFEINELARSMKNLS